MKSDKKDLAMAYAMQKRNKKKMPQAEMPTTGEADEHYESIADAILAKRRAAKMAEGGEVDLDANSEESDNFMDDMNEETTGKEQYDLDQLSDQPWDSNEDGDMIDSDEQDRVGRIRSKIRAKRGM